MPTLRVKVEPPPVLTLVGFRVALVPAGAPLADSEMLSAVPLTIAVLMAEVPLPPCWTETLVGLALIEKSFGTGAVTVRLTVVEWTLPDAEVPVTVMV